ncbi:ubiquitin carboxyl-terminal hydrolase 48 isoform X1 [Lacerta agilis]|uniref:ubiquitin carboxyl-terminal hydrolase 48 isoform X1 n=2 Tax=Lacerta agilis TaxID=80427 RepID=UPI001419DF86|nr:ubiquitin carboxyl-terminal hydrolase 48 isoform X1 [Lacerta agilis]
MAPRLQLEKAAWRWTETVPPEAVTQEHIEAAYRVGLESCQRGACRRNCRGNPNCLVGIGEHIWLGEIDENTFHNIDDPNFERRKKNAFVGLTNLGATCYVNTFLQMWFLNLELRQALYLCPIARPEYVTAEGIASNKNYDPKNICEHLQYLFALLQNSKRRYIDPSGFVKALGLDTGQQQDAQEFSKLFMSLLEDTLTSQKNPDVRDIVQKQFCGEYAYVTVCNQCGRESKLISKFYELELNIQGHKQLSDCITEFLKEEKLEGDNRYFCETCQSKQNATRRIRLLSLPCTLNLQLMRFVFDRQTGHKKKLNAYIEFSELLDMEPYMEDKASIFVYELSAVLIHRGVSAYSGHYIAHVKDPQTGEWYRFNDEEIEKMEGKKLQLGAEEDLEPSKSQTRKLKCGKGVYRSRNAYMLVYRLQTREKSLRVEIPAFLQELVERDNSKFEEWCTEMAEMRKQSVARGKIKHEEVKELYQKLPAKAGCPYDFVSLEWLQQWLDESTPPKPIDNTAFLCPHGKLHPDKIPTVKRVSEYVADYFYKRYGGGPRLTVKALCRDCVVERCRVLRLKSQLNEDYKTVSNLLKVTVKGNDGFWVGKSSLRSWRQLALEQLDDPDEDADQSNGRMNGDAKSKDDSITEKREEEDLKFNEDIICPHGNLCISENERRVVSGEAWEKLQRYFRNAPEFPNSKDSCSQCKVADSSSLEVLEREGEENEALHKMMAGEQKASLPNLFQDKNRPCLSSWPEEVDELYVVSKFFVEEWRKFVRRPTRCSPVSSVGNRDLLCPHGGLMFTFASMTKDDSKLIALIWPSEWEKIQKLFVVDYAIRVIRRQPADASPEAPLFITEPELCSECREGLLCQQQRDLREYAQATIYVRKVVDNKKVMKDAAPELNMSSSEAEEEREEARLEGEQDPDFNQANSNTKRQKMSHPNYIVYQKQGIRRSTRHRKVRGEKALLVSANQTLKDLKIQIMHAFSVAPFDQNLSIDGAILTDDSATLGSLGVTPESVVLLKADEPIVDYAAIDDVMQVCMPEEGFKGTGLLGH